MSKWNLAHYRCSKCGFKWVSRPQPVSCSKCGHFYVEWTNYETWKKMASKEYRRIIDGEE